MDTQTVDNDREERQRLALQKRKLTLDRFSEMMGSYQREIPGDGSAVQGALELAYWSAGNTLTVHSYLESVDEGRTFLARDRLYSEAIQSHKIRALSYWKSMAEVYRYA